MLTTATLIAALTLGAPVDPAPETTPPSDATAPETATAPKDDPKPRPDLEGLTGTSKTRLAVMALSANGVPDDYAVGLTETLATSASETGVFDTISPKQIASLLAYEKRKELMGGCVQESCYVQIAQVVKADHLLAGSVAKVGEKLVLNLVLIDAREGKALKRSNRETANASELMSEARAAGIVVLQPVLSDRRGFLKIASNVPGAQVIIDDERRSEGVGQVIPLAAGPHVLRVSGDGFYATTADVFVRPGRVTEETVKLIPAKETIDGYESKAKLMRYGGLAAGVVAVGAAVLSGVFYAQASDDKELVDRYASALDAERASGRFGTYQQALDARDSFDQNKSLYMISLGTAVATGAASLYLLLAGDDPDRYEEFRSLTAE
ncbi:PEGA domain-containing protein [Myxococcota bacterium]|nr:PEGA domain-containing protein [Myxococcota bacterium]